MAGIEFKSLNSAKAFAVRHFGPTFPTLAKETGRENMNSEVGRLFDYHHDPFKIQGNKRISTT